MSGWLFQPLIIAMNEESVIPTGSTGIWSLKSYKNIGQ
jgi:hypothetical protein